VIFILNNWILFCFVLFCFVSGPTNHKHPALVLWQLQHTNWLWDVVHTFLQVYRHHLSLSHVRMTKLSNCGTRSLVKDWKLSKVQLNFFELFNNKQQFTGLLIDVNDAILGHKSCVLTCKFSPDGKFVVSGSQDKTIKVNGILQNTLHLSFQIFCLFHCDKFLIENFNDTLSLIDKDLECWNWIRSSHTERT
jgi:WD40 repeat protein